MKICLALAIALLVAGCSNSGRTAQTQKPAPDWTEPTSAGGTLTLSSLRGKAVYLNFFATWCQPCKDEAPYISRLQQQFAGRGLQVVGVDELESAKKAEEFRRGFHLAYPAVVDSGTLQAQYNINGLPVHVFISRDGYIRKMVVGQMRNDAILAAVRSIL